MTENTQSTEIVSQQYTDEDWAIKQAMWDAYYNRKKSKHGKTQRQVEKLKLYNRRKNKQDRRCRRINRVLKGK